MARIRQFTNQEGLNPSSLASAAIGAKTSGYEAGQALKGGFNALAGGVQEAEGYVADQEQADYAQKASDLHMELLKEYEVAKQNADPNDPEFAQKFFDNTVKPALDKLDADSSPITKRGQQYQQQTRNTLGAHFLQTALSDQVNMNGAARVATATSTVNKYAIATSQDPANVKANAAMVDQMVLPLIPPEHRGEFQNQAHNMIFKAAGDALIDNLERNPDVTPEMVDQARTLLGTKEEGFTDNVDASVFESWQDRLGKIKNVQGAIQGALMKQQFPALIDQIKAGAGDIPKLEAQKIIDGYVGSTKQETVVNQREMARQLAEAQQFGADAQNVRELPNTKIDQMRQQTTEDYKQAISDDERIRIKARLDAIDFGQDARNKEFNKDPALYAVNHSGSVQAQAAAFDKTPNPQTWATYVSQSEAYQRTLFPDRVPQIATPGMKQAIAASMQGITRDAQGVQKASAVLDQWSQLTGAKWTQVAQELHNDKILNDDQYVAGVLYGKPAARGIADTILQASVMSDSERWGLHATSGIDATKAAIEAFQPLARSLGNAPNGAQIVNAYVKSLAHAMQVRGSVDDAADLAKRMVNEDYTFNETLRIPNSPTLDTGKIQRGTEAALTGIDTRDIVVPPSNSGLNVNDQKANYVERIKSDARWYTNENGSGAILYDMEGGRPVMEKTKNGTRPVEMKWSDLQNLGGANLTTLDRAGRLLTGEPQ